MSIITGVKGFSKVFFIKDKKTIIVDAGFGKDEKLILDALSSNGIPKEDVSLIFLTHGHSDHLGAVTGLKEALNAPVAMGKADAEYLSKGLNVPAVPNTLMGHISWRFLPKKAEKLDVDVKLEGVRDLTEFGVDAAAIPTPGHTKGSCSIVVKGEGCVIGDLLMGFPAGRPGLPMYAEEPSSIIPSVKSILAYRPKMIYPAHGGPWDVNIVKKKFKI